MEYDYRYTWFKIEQLNGNKMKILAWRFEFTILVSKYNLISKNNAKETEKWNSRKY